MIKKLTGTALLAFALISGVFGVSAKAQPTVGTVGQQEQTTPKDDKMSSDKMSDDKMSDDKMSSKKKKKKSKKSKKSKMSDDKMKKS